MDTDTEFWREAIDLLTGDGKLIVRAEAIRTILKRLDVLEKEQLRKKQAECEHRWESTTFQNETWRYCRDCGKSEKIETSAELE